MRFSLRTALILITLLCCALGWWVVQAARQKVAVAAVRDAGGRVHYTYEYGPDATFVDNPEPWAPVWLRQMFGEDLFLTLDGVYFEGQQIDDDVIDRVVPRLRRVSSLRWLELRDSSISDAALDRIAELTQLERLLILSSGSTAAPRTQITDSGLVQLNTLRGLHFLSLGNCTIDGSAFERLDALRRLEHLDLRDTEFHDAVALHLRQFSRLKYLSLWSTQITDSAMRDVANLEHLEELYLAGNELTDAATPELARLTRLKALDLAYTKVGDAGVKSLRPLSQLQELRLTGNLIKNPPVDAFRKLQHLEVRTTRVSDAFLERASRLPELRFLDCGGCGHVTDAGIRHLEKSKSLERMYFPDRRVISTDALRSLQQANPKLLID